MTNPIKHSLMLCLFLLAGCNLPGREAAPSNPTEPAVASQDCGWNWTTRQLPELSAELQAALEAAGLEGVNARAEAYGEDCFDQSGEVLYFAAMETDFRIELTVASLSEREVLGRRLESILTVLDGFPAGSTPGSNPGYVGLSFVSDGENLNLWFPITAGEAARAQGLHGAALLDQLENR